MKYKTIDLLSLVLCNVYSPSTDTGYIKWMFQYLCPNQFGASTSPSPFGNPLAFDGCPCTAEVGKWNGIIKLGIWTKQSSQVKMPRGRGGVDVEASNWSTHEIFTLHIYFTPSFRAIPPLKLGMLCWTMVQTTVTFTTWSPVWDCQTEWYTQSNFLLSVISNPVLLCFVT